MNKYRVLKSYPKQITNSGRLKTLKEGMNIYLKTEPQILRLVRLGYIKPIIEMKKKVKKAKPTKKKEMKSEFKSGSYEPKHKKKNKGKGKDSNESN